MYFVFCYYSNYVCLYCFRCTSLLMQGVCQTLFCHEKNITDIVSYHFIIIENQWFNITKTFYIFSANVSSVVCSCCFFKRKQRQYPLLRIHCLCRKKKFCVFSQLQTDFSFNLNFTLSCIKICKAQSNLSIITTSF